MHVGEALLAQKLITRETQEKINGLIKRRVPGPLPPMRFGDIALHKKFLHLEKLEAARRTLYEKLHEGLRQHKIPIAEVFEQIQHGRGLLLLGAGFSLPGPRDAPAHSGLTGRDLSRRLMEEAGCRDRRIIELGLPHVITYLRRTKPTFDVIRGVERICGALIPAEPLWHQRVLARLSPFRFIVTTNWDRLVQHAFDSERGPGSLTVVQNSRDIPKIDLGKTTLIKLHGDFDGSQFVDYRAVVLSIKDAVALRSRNPLLFSLLETLYTTHTIVVIGFRPDDHNFVDLYLRLLYVLGRRLRQIYLINPGADEARDPSPVDVSLIKLQPYEFLDYMDVYLGAHGHAIGLSSLPPRSKMGDSGLTSPHRYWASAFCDHASALRQALRLRHLEIVESHSGASPEEMKFAVGRHASHLLRDWVCPGDSGDSVAFGGGGTLKALVEGVEPTWRNLKKLRLFATVTPAFDTFSAVAPITLVSLLADKLHSLEATASAYQIPQRIACGCTRGLKMKKAAYCSLCPPCLPLKRAMEGYRSQAASCRMIFLGVGAIDGPYGGFRESCVRIAELVGGTAEEYVEKLRERDYIGDLMYRPFKRIDHVFRTSRDWEGYFVTDARARTEKDSRLGPFLRGLQRSVFGLEINEIRAAAEDPLRQVILVASGAAKASPVLSLCRAGLAGALVIDSDLAHKMSELMELSPPADASDHPRSARRDQPRHRSRQGRRR